MLNRPQIAALIPHAGSMVLLDRVLSWDDNALVASADSHRDPANPLRSNGGLAAVHLIEYGAQAMAIHGGLLAQRAGLVAAPGLLAGVRDVQLHVHALDTLSGPLTVSVTRLVAGAKGWLYAFRAESNGQLIGSGRVSVIATSLSSA